jgi:methyltransferase
VTGAGLTGAEIILGLVTAQRAAELVVSHRNTSRLMARGALEVARGHYPFMVAVHALWLIVLWIFGRDQPVHMPALTVYLALQAIRFWVIRTLGERWTTRIIVLPGAPLVSAGPYRFLAHPNYAVVAAEIATLPMVVGLPGVAAVFTVLNAIVLLIRIRAENRALEPTRPLATRSAP